MCGHCDEEWGCHGGHHYPRSYGPGRRCWQEPAARDSREYLEEEKRILERRLKELEARMAETN
jgi:hypothetical protein